MPTLLCLRCGLPIGVYEPLVLVAAESDRETSRASEPALSATDGDVFHRECYLVGGARLESATRT